MMTPCDFMAYPVGKSTFCAGITLELLHAQSANEKWEPTFLSVVTKIVNKVRTHA